MGTRGFVGFVAEGKEKIAYNHSDSYPAGLGNTVLQWLRAALADLDALKAAVANLRVITEGEKPTPEDIEQFRPYTDLSVGEQSEGDWYCLLRRTQRNPAAMLRAGAIEDASDFPRHGLFAEWGYLVDLDAEVLEVYRGFEKEPHDKGRFARRGGEDGYQPVALVASWPLKELPSDEDFRRELEGDDEDGAQ